MSLFSAMNTAVSGLGAQSKALGSISDNVANSQTVGFKRVDTSFESFVTVSNKDNAAPGTVSARPQYRNSLQGGIEAVESETGLAISGQGFFPVRRQIGEDAGTPTFDGTQYYTRAGDFGPDRNGYLVNSSGHFLDAWPAVQDMTTGVVDVARASTQPVQLAPRSMDPVATRSVTFAANLPSNPPADETGLTSTVEVYDAVGNARRLDLAWTKDAADRWLLDVDAPGSTADPVAGTGGIRFDFGTSGATAGTLVGLSYGDGATPPAAGARVPDAQGAGTDPAYIDLDVDYGYGPQTVRLSLGTFGRADGLTQFAGSGYEVRDVGQDGAPRGNYSSVSISDTGDVQMKYDNGLSRTIARIPLATFANPDALQRTDGQAFTRTMESGEASVSEVGADGAGKIVVGAVERSNVDIAAEFTKLIVAQRAYTANTRIVTASDEMLTETINMKR